MIPKRSSKLYRQVSEDLNVNASLVEDLIDCFYKEVRQNLTNLKHPRLNVEGLGHFVVKPGTVRKAIPRYQKSLENHDTSTFGAYYNKKMIEGKLEALIDIEQKISKQEEKKEQFKQDKNEVKLKGNMEEPETDS
jgi:nucleoid DNA-binding protein